MPRNKGSIYNFPNTEQGFGDYVMQDLMPQPGGSTSAASRQMPNYKFNEKNFTPSSKAPASQMSIPQTSFGGTTGNSLDSSQYSLLDKDMTFDSAVNTIKDMAKKDPSFVQQLQGMSAGDKMKLASSAVASGAAGIEAQTKGQAIAGGVSAGLSAGMTAASMIGADAAATAAAGGVATMSTAGAMAATGIGAVVALGVMAAGMNSAKQAKERAEDEKKKQEKQAQKAEELRLLSTYHDRRAKAMDSLIGAFRRR